MDILNIHTCIYYGYIEYTYSLSFTDFVCMKYTSKKHEICKLCELTISSRSTLSFRERQLANQIAGFHMQLFGRFLYDISFIWQRKDDIWRRVKLAQYRLSLALSLPNKCDNGKQSMEQLYNMIADRILVVIRMPTCLTGNETAACFVFIFMFHSVQACLQPLPKVKSLRPRLHEYVFI